MNCLDGWTGMLLEENLRSFEGNEISMVHHEMRDRELLKQALWNCGKCWLIQSEENHGHGQHLKRTDSKRCLLRFIHKTKKQALDLIRREIICESKESNESLVSSRISHCKFHCCGAEG